LAGEALTPGFGLDHSNGTAMREFANQCRPGSCRVCHRGIAKKVDEFHLKAASAKTLEEMVALNNFCNSCEKSAMQFTAAIRPLISDWFQIESKERSWKNTDHPR
jgi:hypothetical protein